MTGPRMALTQHSSASVALVLLVLVLASMVAPAAPRQPRPRQAARSKAHGGQGLPARRAKAKSAAASEVPQPPNPPPPQLDQLPIFLNTGYRGSSGSGRASIPWLSQAPAPPPPPPETATGGDGAAASDPPTLMPPPQAPMPPPPEPPTTQIPPPSLSPQPPLPRPSPPGPTLRRTPLQPAAVRMPFINSGLLANGSEPRVLRILGPARSTYHYYHPEYRPSTLYCADALAKRKEAYLMAYPWVAYCASYMGGMSQRLCGSCLRLTNRRTGTRGIVRIVDMCGHKAVDADYHSAFIPLDTDLRGYHEGQLNVTMELVAC